LPYFIIIFILSCVRGLLGVEIDSVWMNEETICNDSNIVQICYVIRDGPTNIVVSLSEDDGRSWDVPLNTLFDADGDIGMNVGSGTHCFYWLMSADYPGREGRNFLVRVQARTAFIDTFSFLDTTRYVINGNDGYVDYANGYFVLTTPSTNRNGRILSVDSVYTDTLYVSFDFRMWAAGGARDPLGYTGADGISFILSRYPDPPLALGGAVGILYTGGIGVELDNWYNGSPCDINSNHIGISIDSVCGTGLPTSLFQSPLPFELIDNNWHHVEISIEGQHWRVFVDGTNYIDIVLSTAYYTPFWAYVGFAASTGASYCWQVIDNFRVYSPYLMTVESERTAYAPLDSRNPLPRLFCPDTALYVGENLSLHFNVSDSFYYPGYGGQVHFSCCGFDTTFLVRDTLFSLRLPNIECESSVVVLRVADSFCNTGSSTCHFPIRRKLVLISSRVEPDTLICLPNGHVSPNPVQVRAIVTNIGTYPADSVRVTLRFGPCFSLPAGSPVATILNLQPARSDTIIFNLFVNEACEGRTECISIETEGF